MITSRENDWVLLAGIGKANGVEETKVVKR